MRDGDPIRLDVPNRTVDLLVDEQELARRRSAFASPPLPDRGLEQALRFERHAGFRRRDLDFLQ